MLCWAVRAQPPGLRTICSTESERSCACEPLRQTGVTYPRGPMSKLLRNAKRRAKGAKAVRFEFSLEVQTLKLGADVADPMQLQWTRGSKAAVTDFVEPVNSTINWNTRLDLVVTLFADKNIDDPETVKFASKNSKIAVVAKTIRGSKRVGRCQIDLSEYAALTHNTCRPAHILLEKCNKPCELSVVVHARPLDLDVDTEETPSVASDRSMSMMSMSTMAMSPAPSTSPAPSLHRRAPSARKNLFARTDSVDSKSHQLFATSENDTVSDKPAPASDTPKEAKTQNDKSSKPTHQRKAETPKRDTKTETQVEPSLSAQTQPIEPSTEDASKRASRSSFVSSRRTRSVAKDSVACISVRLSFLQLKSVESQTRALSPVLPVSQETHVSHKPALELVCFNNPLTLFPVRT
ncbi:MAG: hypothetical protein MHM6MM_000210 [Cercozoa sp. M6MM]